MQIEIPPELGKTLIRDLVDEILPFRSKRHFAEHPYEWLIFNFFTDTLRDAIFSSALKGVSDKLLAREKERYELLVGLLTMVIHKVGNNKVEILRDEDGGWYDTTKLQLTIKQNDDSIVLAVEQGDDVD
jgi:hypothetical protein